MTRKVLVTGGAGYIGSHVCKALADANYLPVTFDNLINGHDWAVQWGPLVKGDVLDADALARAIQTHNPDSVVHLAGLINVAESVSDPDRYINNNVNGTRVLLQQMVQADISRIVFSSTCAVYGNPEHLPLTEDHPTRPVSPYGETKLAVERELEEFAHSHHLHYLSLRYFNAAGADSSGRIGELHEPETHLIPLAINAALDSSVTLPVYGTDYPTPDGTAIRDYIHVDAIADAHLKALHYLENRGNSTVLNLGTGTGKTVSDVINTVERLAKSEITVVDRPRRSGDPAVLVADPSLASKVLNWHPDSHTFDDIITTALNWHRMKFVSP